MGLIKPKNAISGTDFSGTVVACGKAVKRFAVGDDVFGSTDIDGGCYAEYLSIADSDVVLHKPVNIDHNEASASIEGASTAMVFLKEMVHINQGDKVLVNGASGSVGSAAIQIAKLLGAEVTAVCSAPNHEMVRMLGADYLIDYHKRDFTQEHQRYDYIFDAVGKSNFRKCRQALRKGGVYMTTVLNWTNLIDTVRTSRSRGRKAIFCATGMKDKAVKIKNLEEIADGLANGKLKAIIDRVYPLDAVADAHRYVDKGHKAGNVLLVMAH